MRFAVISNIQSNITALNAVLGAIDAQPVPVERIISAGDVVGLGPHPNDVIDVLRSRDIESVRGNYDDAVAFNRLGTGMDFADAAAEQADTAAVAWTRSALTAENMEYLQNLARDLRLFPMPGSISVKRDVEDDTVSQYRKSFFRRAIFGGLVSDRPLRVRTKRVRVVHGTPRALNEFLREDSANSILATIARDADTDVLVSAHAASPFQKVVERVQFIGVPPVSGAGRLGRAEYAIVDVGEDVSVGFEAIDYDPEDHILAIGRAGLPDSLTSRHGLRLV